MVKNKLKFKLSPELSDGHSWSVVMTPEEVLGIIKEWLDNADDYYGAGEGFNVTLVDMTEEEVKALPEL